MLFEKNRTTTVHAFFKYTATRVIHLGQIIDENDDEFYEAEDDEHFYEDSEDYECTEPNETTYSMFNINTYAN